MWSLTEIRKGNEAAYREFAAEFGGKFERWLRWNGFSHADAVDVAEDGTVHVLLRIERFEPEEPVNAKFVAWAWKVARNYAEDWRRQRRPDIYATLEACASELFVPARLDPIEEREERTRGEVEAECRDSMLRSLVEQLPPVYEQIVLLKDFEGTTTFAQVAHILNIEVGAARVRYHRALKHLRRIAVASGETL